MQTRIIMTSKINIGSNNKTDDDNDNNNNINQQQYDDSIDGDFKGKLLHLSCLWNNPELLSDLLLGDEVCFVVINVNNNGFIRLIIFFALIY